MDSDVVGGSKWGEDACVGCIIERCNIISGACWDTKHSEDFLKSSMIDHVECRTKVYVEKVNITAFELCILNSINDGA